MARGASLLADDDKRTPLEAAIISGSFDALRAIARYSPPQAISCALFLAADLGATECFDVLWSFPFSPNAIDDTGDSLLIRLQKRSFTMMELEGYNIELMDRAGATAVHYAAMTGGLWLIRAADALLETPDASGVTPFGYAMRAGDSSAAELIERCNPDHIDSFGMTPSVYAIASGLTEWPSPGVGLTKLALFPFTDAAGKLRYTVNVAGLAREDVRAAPSLVVFDYRSGKTRTHELAQVKLCSDVYTAALKSDAVQRFLSADDTASSVTLVHLAVLFGASPRALTALLRRFPALIDAPDSRERTPLFWALSLGAADAATILAAAGASAASRDSAGNTLYHAVALAGSSDAGALRLLADVSPLAESTNAAGESALHIAASNGSASLLAALCKCVPEAALTALDASGRSPLDRALLARASECVSVLHAAGVPNRLVVAAASGPEAVEALLQSRYPIASVDARGCTAVHAAAGAGRADVIGLLLDSGAATAPVNASGETPLHVAAASDAWDAAIVLLRRGPRLAQLGGRCPPHESARGRLRRFLFSQFRRQRAGAQFGSFLHETDLLLVVAENALRELECSLQGFVNAAYKCLAEIRFVCRTLRDVADTFDFTHPLHHLFRLATSLDVREYAALLRESAKCPDAPKRSSDLRAALAFPVIWRRWVGRMVARFEPLLDRDCDDADLARAAIQRLADAGDLGDVGFMPFFTDEALGDIRDRVHIEAIVTTSIDARASSPTCLMKPQRDVNILAFFGAPLPRLLPNLVPKDHKGGEVRVALDARYFIIGTRDHATAFPLDVIALRESAQLVYVVMTPVGSFTLTFPYSLEALILRLGLECNRWQIDRCEVGALCLQTSKDNMFQCLCAYLRPGEKVTTMRFMIVRAGKKEECFDSCFKTVSDGLLAPPTFFNVITRELVDESVLFIPPLSARKASDTEAP
jgi:ankyrin repeat protein